MLLPFCFPPRPEWAITFYFLFSQVCYFCQTCVYFVFLPNSRKCVVFEGWWASLCRNSDGSTDFLEVLGFVQLFGFFSCVLGLKIFYLQIFQSVWQPLKWSSGKEWILFCSAGIANVQIHFIKQTGIQSIAWWSLSHVYGREICWSGICGLNMVFTASTL